MADSNKKFNFIHGEHRKIFEKLKSQAKENRLWTHEEISGGLGQFNKKHGQKRTFMERIKGTLESP